MKKLVITSNKVVLDIADDAVYIKNGNIVCERFEKEMIKIISKSICYDASCDIVQTLTPIPGDFIDGRYCYTEERGFYLNPMYVVPDELKNEIIDVYTLQLIEEGMI